MNVALFRKVYVTVLSDNLVYPKTSTPLMASKHKSGSGTFIHLSLVKYFF